MTKTKFPKGYLSRCGKMGGWINYQEFEGSGCPPNIVCAILFIEVVVLFGLKLC